MSLIFRIAAKLLPVRVRRAIRSRIGPSSRSLGGHLPISEMADLATPMAIRVAIGWNLPTLIDSGKSTLEQLEAVVDVPKDRLSRLLRFLAARSLLQEDSEGCYSVTPRGNRVLKPGKLNHWTSPREALGRAELSFIYLDEALKTGKPTYDRLYGAPFWQDMERNPRLGASLDSYMEKNSRKVVNAIRGKYDWNAIAHLVDVGGGRGIVLRELLRLNPSMRGTIIDLPRIATAATAAIDDDGLSSRCNFAAGSFFEPLPVVGATYLLSNVIHDWSDAKAIQILKRCAEAAGDDSRILIVEEILELGADPLDFTHSDLQMLVIFGAQERTLQHYRDLISEAGLVLEESIPTGRSYSILVCRPANMIKTDAVPSA